MNILLKKVENDESEFYFKIRKETLRKFLIEYKPWDEESERKNMPNKINFKNDQIIYDDDKKIGLFSFNENDANIYLDYLNLLPEYQQKGIGSSLIEKLAKKNKPIKTDTYKNNFPAIAFFKKNGFVIIGENDKGTYPKFILEKCNEV